MIIMIYCDGLPETYVCDVDKCGHGQCEYNLYDSCTRCRKRTVRKYEKNVYVKWIRMNWSS